MNISLSPFAPASSSREAVSAVPSRVRLLLSILRLNVVLTDTGFLSISAAASIYLLYCHTPVGQSRVYRVTQLRTDGVHCRRESTDTGPVALKVVPVTGAAFAGHHGPINVRLSFPTPTIIIIGMKWAC